MTKKLAELSGSISVLSASIILILAFLISHVSLPKIRVTPPAVSAPAAVQSEEAKSDQELAPLTPIPGKANLPLPLSEIFSAPVTALSDAAWEARQSRAETAKQVISSVLAVSQSVSNFPVTISVTAEEYEMMLYCVGHETRSGSLPHKILIAQVILNRAQGPKFGSSIKEVLLAPGQFNVMAGFQGWGDWRPDETTTQAVNLVLSGASPDYAKGAVYFCNPYLLGEENWFDTTRQAVCEIEGHRFYR